MKKIGIIGLGLIGGSIAKALKNRLNYNIVAFNRSEPSLLQAYKDGIISEYTTTDMSIFTGCNIVYVCTSVDLIVQYVEKLIPYIDNNCIITDVGSTKAEICRKMQKFSDIKFIGGHPMAGSEKTGYKAAKEFLFENAYYILTPNDNVSTKELEAFTQIVRTIGAIPIYVSPQQHDYMVAGISHAPHIIASALVNMVESIDTEDKLMHSVAAGGFKDITRIASSSPEVWSSICFDNKQEILKVLSAFKAEIDKYEKAILKEDKSIYDYFEKARVYRNSFATKSGITADKAYEVYVDITNTTGILAKIVTLLSKNGINIQNIGIVNNREYLDGILHIVLDNQQSKEKAIEILSNEKYTVYNKDVKL